MLTLTVMLAVAWPLSGWRAAGVWLPGNRNIVLMSGCLWLSADQPPPANMPPVHLGPHLVDNNMGTAPEFVWRFLHVKNRITEFATVPLWSILPPMAAATVFAWRERLPAVTKRCRTAARRRRGACVSCGYDRRGLAAAAACPECGSVPTA